MNSFLLEKAQINCQCFDNSPQTARRIFRSQSHQQSSIQYKHQANTQIRNQSEKGKNKKKSLKKQKPFSSVHSEKDQKQKQDAPKQIYNQNLVFTNFGQNKKQFKKVNFQYFDSGKVHNLKSQKAKPANNLRMGRAIAHLATDPFNMSLQKVNENLKMDHNIEIDRAANKQFQRDFSQFRIQMQRRQKFIPHISAQQSQRINKRQSQLVTKIIYQKIVNDNQQSRINESFNKMNLNLNIKQTNVKQTNIKQTTIKQTNIKQATIKQTNENTREQKSKTPIRPASFRNSAVTHNQKQSISKKIKYKMIAKQIQSENDGSQSSSDRMSQVVARGWEGMTEQMIQFQHLDMNKETMNSQTMVTQTSNIKNSQIKTFTDYSNSFISPKSQDTKGIPFGGGHKYGRTGLSYQLIDNLGKMKDSQAKIHF